MRRRILSVALAVSMVFSLFTGVSLPIKTYAADAKSSSNVRDIDEDTYGELGLSLKVDEDAAPVPYSESNATKLAAGQEIYVAANGISNNRYTVRDGFDTINKYHNRTPDRRDDYGQLDGAYDYYQDVNNSVPSYYGGTTASKISSNRTNSLANEYNEFSGIYAASVEFDGGDGKENYIAEIRAHKKEETTVYNGKTYRGKLTLNIFKIDENGTRTQVAEYSPGLNDSSFSSNGNMMYFARRYVQELEVIFDIKKGDVNGDGLDDLFLYTGRYTDISDVRYAVIDVFYGDGNGRFTRGDDIMQSCGSSADFKTSDNWYEWVFGIPTASLATGDLDRDGKDELAVTVSTSTEHNNVAAAGHLSVFYCVNNNMAYVEGLKDIPLANPDVDGRGMAAANCTFGDFVMPDSDLAVTTLIVGGYYEGEKMNMYTPFSEGAYFYIYKNLRGKGYRISDYKVMKLGYNSRYITESYKEYMGYYNRPVHAPISMACADLDGMANGKPGDSILFGAEVYDFTIKDGLGDQIGEISLCSEQYNGSKSAYSHYYSNDKSQVWIGDVKVGSVDTNAADYNYRESFVCVVGVRNGTENYNTSKDYYWMDIAVFTLVDGKGYSSQEGVISNSNPRNDTYGTFISLSLPDIDDDAVIMEFEEKYVVYTNPEVYAVLEASPYFADLQEAYDYVNNGGTSYSTSTGSSSSSSAGFSQTVGVYTSAEASFFGSAEFETEIAAGASYEYETTRTTEYEISYNAAGGGTDQVVMFCLKYMYYVYNMYIPAEQKWEKVIMPVSLGSSTSILDVEDYDKIAEKTRGLSPVRDNILYNTPGFPETYGGAVYGSSVYTFPGSYSGVAASQGADQTQTITVTTEESSTWTFSLEINVKAGAGGGFLGNNAKAGVTSHTEAGFGTATANSEGMSFSGTVDNVPRDCSDFTFDWKLIVNSARLNGSGNPVWVVGYDVRGVERPPYMPMGLTVTDATKNSISLAWDSVEKVSFYELYMLDAKGNYNLKATVPYTVTDYTVKGLIPNRTYSFAVRSVDSLGAKSIHSPSATASTLQDSANFKITKHPADTSTYSGGTAEFSAGASYEDGDGISRPVGYCWQVCEDGEWKNVKRGGTVATLKLIGVSDDMDGYEYRCRVYYNDITLYTKTATLSVDKAASVASLSLCYSDSGEIINDKEIVHATGGVSTTREETISRVDPVIVVTSDNTFVLVTDGTNYLWEDENKNYYECTATISTDAEGYIVERTTLDSSSIGTSTLSVDESGYKASVTSVETDENGSSTVTKTSYALTSATAADGETVSYTSDSIMYNVIKSKWTDSDSKYSFYLLSTSDDSSSVYYYVSNSDATKCGECSISCSYSIKLSESVTVSEASLKDAMIKSSSKVNVMDDTLYSGETVQLACKPTSLSGEAITGPVKFSISGPNYELLTGTFDSTTGNYIASWVPKGEGTYTIYSVFEGNNLYNSSISTEMTVYTTFGDRKTLCLDVDSEVNYGDDVDFVLYEVNGADGKTTDITESNGIEYTVYKYNPFKRSFDKAAASAYSLSGSVFIPKEIGNFKLKAERNGSTVEEIINVSMAKIIISAVDTEKGINDADRSCADAVITGIKSWDRQYTPVRDVDYELVSDGVSSNILGEYTINGSILRNEDNSYTDNIAYLSERYNLGMRAAQYTLTGNVYTVTAKTANTHGSVSINYKQNKNDANDGLEVESGMKLPENSQIILYATPAKGYKVKRWTINGKTVTNAQGSTDGNGTYSDTQVEIESLAGDVAAVVNFEPVYHSLTYLSDNAEYGTVSANYITDGVKGNAFGSGGNIHIEQTVRITAEPKPGYTLDHWTVTGEDGIEETVLAEDEVTEYTALSYDAEEISENTIVTAYFAETDDFSISVSPVVVGSDGNPTVATGVDVTVKADRAGQTITIDKGSDGRYDVKKGDNVTVEVTVPSGLFIDGWSAASGQSIGTVASDLKSMTIYNVTSDLDYTVTYTAPNRYKLVFGPDMDEAGKVSAVVAGAADELTSGDKQLQGTDIEFTAKPNSGYEIAYWDVNGEVVEAEKNSDGSEKYVLNYLGKDTKVVVHYYKQPLITWTSGSGIGVTAMSGEENIVNGSNVVYASKDDLTFTTVVKKGYEIDDIIVTYKGSQVYKLSAADSDGDGQLAEMADDQQGTERYTFTWQAPEGGFTGDVNVAFRYKTITPVVDAEYSLDIIEKNKDNPANGKMYGAITATVSRKNLAAYEQTGDTVSDSTSRKTASITGIYRDSVITFVVTPDSGYNVKEWIVDGNVITSQSDTINVSTDKKTNDTLKITVDENSKDVVVMAKLELAGDVLTFGPDVPDTGNVGAVMGASNIELTSGDMLGSPANVRFTALPEEGYVVADWKVNGILQGTADEEFSYKVPTGMRTDVRAVFDRPEYNITWTAEGDGSVGAVNQTEDITLTGSSAKVRGDRTLVFTASPGEYMECTGYTVKTPDGTKDYTAEELEGDVLTIDSVASDMDITAHFAKKELKVTIGFEANDEALGKVTAVYGTDEKSEITSGDNQAAGGDVVFTATPYDGQMIEGWYSDPECTIKIEGTQLEQQTYSAYTLYDNISVYVKFVEIPDYTVQIGTMGTGTAKITAASDGGNVDIVSGEISIKRHKDVAITVTPEDIYNTVEYWIVNGEKVDGTDLIYEITDITDDMTVYAYVSPTLVVDVLFKDSDEIKKYDDIDIKVGYAGEDGDTSGFTSINAVNNNVRIGSGKDVSFELTPSDDYMIGAWTVNYIRGGKIVKTETGDDFGFTNRILLEDVTSSIEVYAELVDKVGYYVPAEGSYNREGRMVEVTDQSAGEETANEDAEKNEHEAAYTISDMNISPDNVSFVDADGQQIPNMVRENGDASVVVAPADGWRIRSITAAEEIIEDTELPEYSAEGTIAEDGDLENVLLVDPVMSEDGVPTGAYKVSTENITKDVAFVVDVVRIYAVSIADTKNGTIKVTKEDGTEVKSGDLIDEGTVLTYKATPDKYYDFDSWTLDAADQTETGFEKTVDGEITVGAAFKARYAKVNIATVQNGRITVKTEQGKVITSGSLVQEGTTIVCTAKPAAHCDFSTWGADAKGKSGTTIKLLVTREMNITAAFKYRYVTVKVQKPVNGQIIMKTADGKTISSGSKIKEGTVIVCTAKASKGCKLKGWTGSITGAQTTKKFAVNKDITISAKFAAQIPAQNTAGINKNIRAKLSGGILKIAWGKVNNADGYDVYMQPCYRSPDYITCVKTVKGSSNVSTTISKMGRNPLNKYDIVKIRVKAYKYSGGKKKYIQNSVMFHIVTNNKTYTNIKSVTVPRKAYALDVNQTVTLKPSVAKASKSKKLIGSDHGAKLYYSSTNTNVATVDAKGRIKAKASGKCTVYVISISGVTVPVQITVK